MSQEGDQGVSQSGFIVQDASARNGKRCRDQSEEGSHSTAQCIKTMDLNLSSDIVSSDCGGNGREDQDSFLNNLAHSQSEKRIKCGPSDVQSNSQTPISSSLTANVDVVTLDGGNDVKGITNHNLSQDSAAVNVDVVALDGGNDVKTGITNHNLSQDCAAAVAKVSDKVAKVHIQKGTQFYCDICSVKSTSAKDWETHLAGKRHAKAKELALGMGTPSVSKSSRSGFNANISTSQKIQASIENGSTDLNSKMYTTSFGQQVLVDGSGETSKGYIPGCTSGTNVEELNFQASVSKCLVLSDANAVAVGQHASIDCPFRETFVNQGLKSDPSSKVACNHAHNRYLCQPGTNGTFQNPTLADSLLEKISSRIISEDEPYKHLMASLSTKSNSDCVAQALASALSTCGCPGLGDLQKGGSGDQAAGCSDSQLEGATIGDSNGMVTMHARCFSNLLHEVRVSVLEDLFLNGGFKTNTWVPSAAPVSASVPHGEDLNCSVCRVEYGSKADLDLHLAGRKHASLVQRVYSRCQLCNLNCNTERDFQTHLSGKKHASKLRLVQKRVTF